MLARIPDDQLRPSPPLGRTPRRRSATPLATLLVALASLAGALPAGAAAPAAATQRLLPAPLLAAQHPTLPQRDTSSAVPTAPVAPPTAAPAPEPAARPRPLAALSTTTLALRDSLVARARAQIGRRYRRGGQSPERGFDCSGLVRYVMGALDVPLPRTAAQQARTGTALGRDTAQLRPGDLLAFGRGRAASHVGIYVGEGRYVHASSKAGRVIESRLDRPASPLIRAWRDSRRVVPTDSVALADER